MVIKLPQSSNPFRRTARDGLVAFLRRKVQGAATMHRRSIRVTMGLIFAALAFIGGLSVATSL